MQTIIGIGICLIVVIYFSIGFMNTYHEGLTSTTPVESGQVVASASGAVSLKTAAEQKQNHSDALGQTIGVIDNPINVATYTEMIDNLLNYYDYQTLIDISNAQPDANGKYDLKSIAQYKAIKDALNDSLAYLHLVSN